MNRLMMTALSLGVALSLAACNEAPSEAPPPKPAATQPAPAAPPPAPAADVAAPAAEVDGELPVPADFEEVVAAEITADNYAAELDKLEAELSP